MSERALMGVVPFCPKCGAPASFASRPTFVGDFVRVECSDYTCNWHGESPTVCPVPDRVMAQLTEKDRA